MHDHLEIPGCLNASTKPRTPILAVYIDISLMDISFEMIWREWNLSGCFFLHVLMFVRTVSNISPGLVTYDYHYLYKWNTVVYADNRRHTLNSMQMYFNDLENVPQKRQDGQPQTEGQKCSLSTFYPELWDTP